ncbi:MAG: prolyl oligopeptidase family serine peptidase [Anaerolineae bacterium]|nr:prolyl oligopeptidase family serine peptidase [Anaerolineae bacterium]
MREQISTFSATMSEVVRLPYLLTLPHGYNSNADPWPLILFLHGAGERGTDVDALRVYGMPKVAPRQREFPFITVSPVCPVYRWWGDYLPVLIGLLDDLQARYQVDPDRVYLTGLSMGGFGTWHLAVEYPERFAAIAPICGGAHWAYGIRERIAAIRDVPAWVFHGAQDDVVPLEESEVLVRALEEAGGDARFTVYPEADHDSWTATYDNPELYTWFLAQRRGGSRD